MNILSDCIYPPASPIAIAAAQNVRIHGHLKQLASSDNGRTELVKARSFAHTELSAFRGNFEGSFVCRVQNVFNFVRKNRFDVLNGHAGAKSVQDYDEVCAIQYHLETEGQFYTDLRCRWRDLRTASERRNIR